MSFRMGEKTIEGTQREYAKAHGITLSALKTRCVVANRAWNRQKQGEAASWLTRKANPYILEIIKQNESVGDDFGIQ